MLVTWWMVDKRLAQAQLPLPRVDSAAIQDGQVRVPVAVKGIFE